MSYILQIFYTSLFYFSSSCDFFTSLQILRQYKYSLAQKENYRRHMYLQYIYNRDSRHTYLQTISPVSESPFSSKSHFIVVNNVTKNSFACAILSRKRLREVMQRCKGIAFNGLNVTEFSSIWHRKENCFDITLAI